MNNYHNYNINEIKKLSNDESNYYESDDELENTIDDIDLTKLCPSLRKCIDPNYYLHP